MNAVDRQKMQISIEVPPELEATYANLALITHTASEIILDFARVLPNTPKGKVYARIVTTPLTAKLLVSALNENIEKYEAQYGEVRLATGGSGLAEQLFGQTRPSDGPSI